MKIKLEELAYHEPLHVKVEGHEEWLEEIYRNYPVPAGHSKPQLAGQFQVTRFEGDYVQLRGEFSYAPFVKCSRCDAPITWPIHESLDLYYSAEEPQEYIAEKDLSLQELDERYLQAGELDLELALNEAVVLAIPSRTVGDSSQAHTCQVEELPSLTDCLYASKETPKSANPFSVLKDLKLKD